jgi:hypothetical protein
LRRTRGDKKNSKNIFENQTQNQRNHLYFDFKKYLVDIFSVSGIFIEDYVGSLTSWEKFKNRFGIGLSTQKFVHYLLGSVIDLNQSSLKSSCNYI